MPAVLYEQDGLVATITLARPEHLNALDEALKNELRDILSAAAADQAVRAVLLTGAGRAFCVGQDLREHQRNLDAGRGPDSVKETVTHHYAPIATALMTMPKPVVAAVNGVAAGAGAALAFACDFRIVSDAAGFNMGFAAIGLAVDSGLSWSLPRLVGLAKAKELLLMPTTLGAAEALELGLATRVVEPDALLPSARELAGVLAQGPTVAYGAIRRSVAFSATHGLEESLALEAEMMALTAGTSDHAQAVRAFLDKTKPRFEGR